VSRATALAYEPAVSRAEPVADWPGRGDSSIYRLLGDDAEFFGGPRPIVIDGEPFLQLAEEGDYLQEVVAMPGAYFAALESDQAAHGLSRTLTRLVIFGAVAVLLAVALALVTPALANGRLAGGGASLSLSKYAEMVASAPVSVTDPQIDVAPQPQPVAPVAAPGDYSLVAAPSVSVAQIEAVLNKYGSPAVGLGQALYDLGVRYGIDPAYALAFFVHESGCGTRGVARFTHSLGNIRWTEGYESYEGYRMYGSWQEGMEDWYKLITDLYINGWGLKTVDAIIPVYAPAADSNNPPVYVASVKSMVDSWRGK